jgi:hypothetical protein
MWSIASALWSKKYRLSGGPAGYSNLFLEVTMSHWRRSHEPEHSYIADWVIVAAIVLALMLIVAR